MAQWEAATVAAVGAAAISDPPGMTLTGFYRYDRNANLRNARSCSSPQTRNNNGALFREDIHKFPHESAWG